MMTNSKWKFFQFRFHLDFNVGSDIIFQKYFAVEVAVNFLKQFAMVSHELKIVLSSIDVTIKFIKIFHLQAI